MKPRFAPEEVSARIIQILEDETRPAYGQVATLRADGSPTVRTVHLRYLRELGTLGFNTHMMSQKWAQLSQRPSLSGCHLTSPDDLQLRWHGRVELIRGDDSRDQIKKLLDRMWRITREDVRAVYWSSHGRTAGLDERCPDFAIVACIPDQWDISELHEAEYSKNRRIIYTLTEELARPGILDLHE